MEFMEYDKYGIKKEILTKLTGIGINEFTSVQKAALESGLCHEKSLVIAAPTSTGKTMIAEIAAINGALNGIKTIYLVTHKALAEEKYNYFKRHYGLSDKWFDVSIATGDRNEGEWETGILVATYEKYLGLLSVSEHYAIRNKIVVVDEIQILGDLTRGSDIEILCSIIRDSNPRQIIALSATAPNVNEIAEWLNCKPIKIEQRDVPLRQEVWFDKKRYYNYFGSDREVVEDKSNKIVSSDIISAVKNLLSVKMGPVLVFTMTRPQAFDLAYKFSKSREQDAKAFEISDQLDLFTEPTSLSNSLRDMIVRRVGFHSTDLSFAERSVIEDALKLKKLDVVFSTPTLAAGVNYPIKTVLFASFHRSWLSKWIPKSEYLNMSGRAGRLNLDKEGYAILIPNDKSELNKTKEYVSIGSDPIESVLFARSARKTILHLISIHICKTELELNKFFQNTFWWQQTEKKNPKLLARVAPHIIESLKWLLQNKLISKQSNKYIPTSLGKTISSTGLLPSTGISLLTVIRENEKAFTNSQCDLPLIHAVCGCDEFDDTMGQRFLPYARRGQPEAIAKDTVESFPLFTDPLSHKYPDQVINATYAIYLWSNGESESKLKKVLPPTFGYGQLHALSADIAWILEGLYKISRCKGIVFKYPVQSKINILSQKIKLGVTEEAFDVIKAAYSYQVPGFARQRAMALVKQKISTPNVLINTNVNIIAKLVDGKERAHKLIEAVSEYFSAGNARWQARHVARITGDVQERDLILQSYDAQGKEYEDIIESMIIKLGWKIKKLDSNKRQGVPDFQIEKGKKSILVECKTKNKQDAVISRIDALEVLTKGANIKADHCITIGKPDFESFAKTTAEGSSKITLIPHYSFIEGYIRWKDGKMTSDELFSWLTTPGVASVENM